MIHSPPAAASPVASLAEARAGLLRGGSGAAPPALGGPFSLGALSLALDAAPSGPGEERVESRWQLVEELLCPLVAASPGGGGAAAAAAAAAPALQPLHGEAVLPPGPSVLTFLAAPVKRGLYKALHLRAALQQLPLHVAVRPPAPLWPAGGAAATSAASGAAGAAGAAGSLAEEAVLLVEQAQPRVQLSLLAAGGSLIAGQEQWLGLLLAPERDTLHGARLELSWPLSAPPPARGLAGERGRRRRLPCHACCVGSAAGAAGCRSSVRRGASPSWHRPFADLHAFRCCAPPQACPARPRGWRLRTAPCSLPTSA